MTAHVPSSLLSISRSEKAHSCGRTEALRESYPSHTVTLCSGSSGLQMRGTGCRPGAALRALGLGRTDGKARVRGGTTGGQRDQRPEWGPRTCSQGSPEATCTVKRAPTPPSLIAYPMLSVVLVVSPHAPLTALLGMRERAQKGSPLTETTLVHGGSRSSVQLFVAEKPVLFPGHEAASRAGSQTSIQG